MSQEYSDKTLNAYLDGELTDYELNSIRNELRINQDLQRRIALLDRARFMVKMAYLGIESE